MSAQATTEWSSKKKKKIRIVFQYIFFGVVLAYIHTDSLANATCFRTLYIATALVISQKDLR